MDLKTYLKELVEEALSSAIDFGLLDNMRTEQNFDMAAEELYRAIDRLVTNKKLKPLKDE